MTASEIPSSAPANWSGSSKSVRSSEKSENLKEFFAELKQRNVSESRDCKRARDADRFVARLLSCSFV
jgi:hypothetical protein